MSIGQRTNEESINYRVEYFEAHIGERVLHIDCANDMSHHIIGREVRIEDWLNKAVGSS